MVNGIKSHNTLIIGRALRTFNAVKNRYFHMEHLPADYGSQKSKINDPTLHIAPKDATVSVASFGEVLE